MKAITVVASLCIMMSFCSCANVENRPDANSKEKITKEPIRLGPAIEVLDKEIELGSIPAMDTEIMGQVIIINPGSETLEIKRVNGPCTCFLGSMGEKRIPPGEAVEVIVQFDANKIKAGRSRKLVNIHTNDPKNHITRVYFNFTIESDPIADQFRELKTEMAELQHQVNYLRAELKKMQSVAKETPSTRPVVQPKSNRPPPDTTVYQIAMGDSPILGAKEAAVTIVEFGDFQCPYCVREYPKIKEILQQYPDQVRYTFKHYPLRFHKKAPPAHASAELARREKGTDAFWQMHDLIMANPKKLEIADLRGYAQSLNLDMENFDAIMANPEKINELLQVDLAEAKKCKVRATPTVLINGLKMTNRTLEGYQVRINQILKNDLAAGK
jgi:protein-disulfide isomerase